MGWYRHIGWPCSARLPVPLSALRRLTYVRRHIWISRPLWRRRRTSVGWD
jgi:hypothetical protein